MLTNEIYRNLTGVSEMRALRDLEALVAQGSLHAVRQERGREYRR